MAKTRVYSYQDFKSLEDCFTDYLGHRLFHPSPHHTFKRYLVSVNQRHLCDLLDDFEKGLVFSSRRFDQQSYAFSVNISNIPGYRGKIVAKLPCF